MFDSGAKVKVFALESEEGKKLNGLEGVVDHYATSRERYAVSLPGQEDLKMIKEKNLELLDAGEASAVFTNEAEMLERMKAMGMPEDMLKGLTAKQKQTMFEMTQRQDILEKAKKAAGIESTTEEEEMKEAAGGLYSWRQGGDHVDIEVPVGKDEEDKCVCEITPETISIAIADRKILQGSLFQKVDPKACKSDVKDGKLVVKLGKASKMRWLMIVR